MVHGAVKDLERGGREVELAGFLWHQGENDMLDPELMTGYGERLERFISRVRKDLQAPELPFFIGEISDKGIWGLDHRRNMQVVREQQRAVCAKDAHVHWVETSHLAFKVNREGHPHYHFGTEGQLQHGVAYARAYLASIGVDLPLPLPPYSARLPLKSGSRVRVFLLAGQRSAEGDGAYVKELQTFRDGKALAKPRKSVLLRYRLGGGALTSPDWCPLAPASLHGTFGPELSLGARLDEKLKDPVAILKLTHSAA